MRKLKLELEALEVDSFETSGPDRAPKGTVEALQAADDCTWFYSCVCNTAYYVCNTAPGTHYSCKYTHDERCYNTRQEVCGTPPGA